MRALTAEEEVQFQALAHSAVSPAPRPNASSANVPARTVGETMVEFVLRVMSAYRFVCEESESGYGSWRNTGKQDNATAIRESDEEQPKAA
ncbi:MAG: hypothetical protein ACM3WP_14835 [Acidobacteriota bacterium]